MAIKLKKEEEIKEVKKEASSNNDNSNNTENKNDNSNKKTNDAPLTKEEKKKLKKELKEKHKKSKFEVFTIIFIVLFIICTVALGCFLISPVISVVLGVFTIIALICYVLFVTVVSIGLLWISTNVRNVVGKIAEFATKCFNFSDKAMEVFSNVFVYFASIGSAFLILSLTFSIIGYVKNKGKEENPYKKHMIVSIVFASLLIIFLIINLVFYFSKK